MRKVLLVAAIALSHLIAQTAAGTTVHAFLWTQQGGMVDLVPYGGGTDSVFAATSVNNLGHVAGSSNVGGVLRAFYWRSPSSIIDIGDLGGGWAQATGVNDFGQIVGTSGLANGEQHAFIWTQALGMIDLGTLGGPHSGARDINNAGQVIGWRTEPSGVSRSFLWDATTGFTDLPGHLAWDIDESGAVLFATSAGLSQSAIRKADGTIVSADTRQRLEPHPEFMWWYTRLDCNALGTLGGVCAYGVASNEHGHVVGHAPTQSGASHAFLWTPENGIIDLGTFPGGRESGAADINIHGAVVGASEWVPEPNSLWLVGAALAGLPVFRFHQARRRSRRKSNTDGGTVLT